MRALSRIVSFGDRGEIPDQLGRFVRVTNVLTLIGLALTITSLPFDFLGAPLVVGLTDLAMMFGFASCWLLNARGHHTSARVTFMLVSTISIMSGVTLIGPVEELRTMFFPLALLPFFIFSLRELWWLALFVVLPVAGYFITPHFPVTPSLALTIYEVYAPVLALFMTIAGATIFAWVQESAEAKLAQTREHAAQAARLAALGEMSSGIAHEIRNPLAAIHIAATQLVERPDDAAQTAQLGERIQRIVMRASRIIEGLRSFSRDAGSDPIVATPVGRIVEDTLELCGKRFAQSGVALTVDVPSDLVLECRSTQLSQVLMNILSNAYDATMQAEGERWVRLTARRVDDAVEIDVANSGPHIPASVRARMFEPFFTTKEPDRGTGLGLSLSRGIVGSHHGTLELDATAPHTRFVMRIPATQARV